MTRPATPFSAHLDVLLHNFRSTLPQVAALLHFMPDELLNSVAHEVGLLSDTMARERARRQRTPHA